MNTAIGRRFARRLAGAVHSGRQARRVYFDPLTDDSFLNPLNKDYITLAGAGTMNAFISFFVRISGQTETGNTADLQKD
ncbi:hypothetical protein [Mucilaginibacter kameinonensis]|uniref:hypothetical protein n=1 Tax=Mucilaginibacter kameinonensis TaxID=452286 RepID=UPI0013CF0ED7|nr:hypothetical protein [Mucilaginibacter kameinonensis]